MSPIPPPGAPPWPGPQGPFGAVIAYMTGRAYAARRAFNASRANRGLPPIDIYDESNHAWINIPVNFALVVVDGAGIRHPVVGPLGIAGFGQHEDQGWWAAFCGPAVQYYNDAATAALAGNPLPPPPVVSDPIPPPITPTLPPGTPPLPPADSTAPPVEGQPLPGDPDPFPQCAPGFYLNLAARPPRCEPLPSTTTPPAPVEHSAVLLLTGRYRVSATFDTGRGQSGEARFIPITTDSANAWFFSANNIELTVKVIGNVEKPWFFAAGLTNVEVTLTLKDTVTGEDRMYHNPQGTAFQPIQDTNPFGRA